MLTFFETPIMYMEEFESIQGYGFFFAHLCKQNTEYKKYIIEWRGRHPDDLMILDNGAWEGHLVSGCELVDMALEIGANEVVIPNAINDVHGTLKMAEDFTPLLADTPLSTMLVMQGASTDDVMQLVEYAFYTPHLTTLGFPLGPIFKVNDDDLFTGQWNIDTEWTRARLIKKLRGGALSNTGFAIHLLGCNAPNCLYSYNGSKIRSIDTSAPTFFAMHHVDLDPRTRNIHTTKYPNWHLRFGDSMLLNERRLARKNMSYIKRVVQE